MYQIKLLYTLWSVVRALTIHYYTAKWTEANDIHDHELALWEVYIKLLREMSPREIPKSVLLIREQMISQNQLKGFINKQLKSTNSSSSTMDKERVGYVHHKISQDSLRPGDHIYIHEHGGLTNKHGIVVRRNGELRVVHKCNRSGVVLSSSVDEFRNGKCIRLVLYEQSVAKKRLTRKGTSFTEKCKPPEEVEQNALSALLPDTDHTAEDSLNPSESFALMCTTQSSPESLTVVNQEFPQSDDSNNRICYLDHKIDPDSLQPGDHIYAYRKLGLYHHHGIYIGTNSQGLHIVIHFVGEGGKKSKSTARIKRSTLEDFLQGKKLRLVSYGDASYPTRIGTTHEKRCLPAAEVVRKAEYYAEHSSEWGEYDLFTNNCEMFALFCKTGQKTDHTDYDYGDQTQGFFISPLVHIYIGFI